MVHEASSSRQQKVGKSLPTVSEGSLSCERARVVDRMTDVATAIMRKKKKSSLSLFQSPCGSTNKILVLMLLLF